MKPDDELHDPRISALYRALPDAEPSADTDATIKAAARRAVQAGPRRRFGFTARKLTATAAMLLLVVGLVVQMQVHEPQKLQEALSGNAAPPAKPIAVPPASPAADELRPSSDDTRIATRPAREPASAQASTPTSQIAAAPAAPEAKRRTAPPEAAASAGLAAPAPAVRADEEAALPRYSQRAEAAEKSAPSFASRREQKAALAERDAVTVDYRAFMAEARYADALAALTAPATATAIVDRDLLRLLLGQKANPDCVLANAGSETMLCEFLQLHARGQPLPGDWAARLEAAGLVSGERAYRRRGVETLFRNRPAL